MSKFFPVDTRCENSYGGDVSFYQKYRPKSIADLDLASVREAFGLVLASGKAAHAYLFVGPRGSGKTSTARILSQIVNCEKNMENGGAWVDPCGECEACVAISRGSSVDVIEIDAASNGLVDDIRDLREKIRLAPVQLRKKIYIVDEVHMVSTSGFNALLKTLEEPPAHAMFILCTTESQKVPETIASRCVRITFTKGSSEELVRSLKKVVRGEEMKVEDAILEMIAEATDGSFREGHKLLEQLALQSGEIDEETVTKVLGLVSSQVVKKLIQAVEKGEPGVVTEVFANLEKAGTKAGVLVCSLLLETKVRMEKSVKGGSDASMYFELIDVLITAADRIKMSPLPMLPVELALLSVLTEREGKRGDGKEKEERRLEEKGAEDTMIKSKNLGVVHEDKKVVLEKSITQIVPDTVASIERIKTDWMDFLNSMSQSYSSLAGMLRLVSPTEVRGKSLTISVTSRFQQEILEKETKRRLIEDQMSKVWGPLTYKCVLVDKGELRTEVTKEDDNLVKPREDAIAGAVGMMSAAEKIFGN